MRWEIIDAWREAAAECGIPPIKAFNSGDNFGCAYFQMNQKRGRRWSATNAFLRPVLHRKNLTVLTDASCHENQISRIETATGFEFLTGRKSFSQRRSAKPFLSLGSIGSPQILQLSGVGHEELLKKHQNQARSTPARRRREPARPPADPHAVQGEERDAR